MEAITADSLKGASLATSLRKFIIPDSSLNDHKTLRLRKKFDHQAQPKRNQYIGYKI